ncbi:hypothetical protein BHU72_00050 [Desulfuribacillus stibiiarsenatis]|uniref:RND efflux pump membrane fusion protein barrel-sandwich domain-containing protein n=1 Tax=Desulfuribacillus stibiiarsenatis TaxID=1390249 RepID=A0A1E5L979_9FIRM|nr:efflux RND transporter periplasmic adaptor subunit [Desulfuribacillus stibiiarsenatis]OEH86705.1 hypothetical protein BHU72_00050 [Desulfuribacillus stibiiarsenatis]
MNKVIRTVVLGFAILALVATVGCNPKTEEVTAEPEERIVPITVAEVKTGILNDSLGYLGELETYREVKIMPKTPGKVTQVFVKVGDEVKQGQRLLTLDTTDTLNQMKQQESQITSIEAQIRQAQANMKTQQSNANVRVTSAKVAYEDAKKNLERTEALYEGGAVPLQQLDTAKLQYTNAKNNVESAEKDAKLAEGQEAIDVVKASLEQAKVNYEITKSQLDNMTVTASIAGTVSDVAVDLGEIASQQMAAVTIINVNPILVKIPVPESSISQVKVGDKLPVFISAVGETLEGTVSQIALAADRQSKAFPVELRLDNKDRKLRAGMMARVEFSTRKTTPVPVVPNDSVMNDGKQAKVFVVNGERVILREVTLGRSSAKMTEILEGLEEKEQVVVGGKSLLNDNAKVKVTEVVEINEN